MKTKTLFIAAAMLAAVSARADDRVSVTELPAPVQRAIDSAGGRASVKEVNRKTIDGQVVYDVEFEKDNAINPRVRIAADGTVLRGSAAPQGGTPVLDPHSTVAAGADAVARAGDSVAKAGQAISDRANSALAELDALPASVRESVRKHAAGREIVDVEQETWNGKTVYEVEFRDAGINPRIHVAADGSLVKNEKHGAKSLFAGTQLEDTPSAVQQTVKRELGSKEITDIDKEIRTGRTVYEVEFREAGGNRQIHVAEDGTIVKDDRLK
jgi:uncharacterized membrane protein YkoI